MPKWLFYALILVAGWLLIFRGKLPTVGGVGFKAPSPAQAPPAPKSVGVAAIETGGQIIGTLIGGVFTSGSGHLPSGAPTGASDTPPEQLGFPEYF